MDAKDFAQIMSMDIYEARKVLGVTRATTDADLKRTWKAFARKWHPDKNPKNLDEAKAQFQRGQEAYDLILAYRKRGTTSRSQSGSSAPTPAPKRRSAEPFYPFHNQTNFYISASSVPVDKLFQQFFGSASPFAQKNTFARTASRPRRTPRRFADQNK